MSQLKLITVRFNRFNPCVPPTKKILSECCWAWKVQGHRLDRRYTSSMILANIRCGCERCSNDFPRSIYNHFKSLCQGPHCLYHSTCITFSYTTTESSATLFDYRVHGWFWVKECVQQEVGARRSSRVSGLEKKEEVKSIFSQMVEPIELAATLRIYRAIHDYTRFFTGRLECQAAVEK